MNKLEEIFAEKLTENGDKSYNTTGNNLIDLLFMADFFAKNLDQVHIGDSEKEKLFSMYMRDPRNGQGRRDLGRKLAKLSNLDKDMIVLSGRYDDLWHIPTQENLDTIINQARIGNELAKKWLPRLTGKDKIIAKALCKMYGLTEKEYRKLIKLENTTEYKLSYATEKENNEQTELDRIFGSKKEFNHPLVDTIDFEKVPSLAMTKYIKAFSTREDIKNRFSEYIKAVKEEKAKVNTKTANVHDAYKTVKNTQYFKDAEDNADVVGKKIVEQETNGLELDCICVLDTSGSMGQMSNPSSLCSKATSVAHSLATHSTFARNQVISFSSSPKLMTIKGNTLKDQYQSMYTGDWSNTDFGAVMRILQKLERFPRYIVVMSDMEFDQGSQMSKEKTMKLFSDNGVSTRIIWWTFNDRNKTVPEVDKYGNIYMSGFDLQALLLVPGVTDMNEYIDKILKEYAKKINYILTNE